MDLEDIFELYHIPGHKHFDSNTTVHSNASLSSGPNTCPNTSRSFLTSAHDTKRLILDVYVVSFLCLVGFIGNSLTIAVLRRDRERSNNSTTWLLQSLALVDTFYLMTCLLTQTLKGVVELTDWLPVKCRQYFPYVEPYIWPLTATGSNLYFLISELLIGFYYSFNIYFKERYQDIAALL